MNVTAVVVVATRTGIAYADDAVAVHMDAGILDDDTPVPENTPHLVEDEVEDGDTPKYVDLDLDLDLDHVLDQVLEPVPVVPVVQTLVDDDTNHIALHLPHSVQVNRQDYSTLLSLYSHPSHHPSMSNPTQSQTSHP